MENKGGEPKKQQKKEGPNINVPNDVEQKAAESGVVSDEQKRVKKAMDEQIEARRLENLEKTQKEIEDLRNLF